MYMDEKVYSEEQLQKILEANRQAERWKAYGKQWFLEALAHTEGLVRQGAFPQEAHQVGQIVFRQFSINTESPAAQPEKKEEEPAQQD